MLEERELLERLKNYLQIKETNYAILIDGDWGIGKTYFVKKNIDLLLEKAPEIRKRYKGFIYISLYGIKETSRIDSRISSNILSRSKIFKSLKNKTKSAEMISTLFKIPFINENAFNDVAMEFQNFNQYVLIFDDLERSDVPINELLGYINNLVESEQIKVIVVGNQTEIDVSRLSRNQELKYIFSFFYKKMNNEITDSKKNINKNEIKELTDKFFRESEEYLIIKEKTFGFIYKFQPDVEPILTEFINRYLNKNRKFLSSDKLKEIIDKHEIKNLRTVIIAFSNFRMIEEYIDKIDNQGIDQNEIVTRIFEAILYFSMKNGQTSLDNDYINNPVNNYISGLGNKIEYEEYYAFIIDLVKYGSTKNFKIGFDKLLEHIEFMSKDNMQRDLMYKLQDFTRYHDEEVQESINSFINIVDNGSFDSKYSSVAIEIITTLSYYGFEINKNYVEKIKNLAISKLEEFEQVVRFGRVLYNDELTKTVTAEIEDLENRFDSKYKKFYIDYSLNWLSSFKGYCKENKRSIHSFGLLNCIDLDSFSKWLPMASPREIDDFRRLLLEYKLVANAQEKEKDTYANDLKILHKKVGMIIAQTDEITKKIQVEFLQSNILDLLKDINIEIDYRR